MCVMHADGSGYRQLDVGHRPQWSPDGEYLLYMITRDDGHSYTGSDIYCIRADGTDKTALTSTPDLLEMNPSWAPDGNAIAYDEINQGAIYILPVQKN